MRKRLSLEKPSFMAYQTDSAGFEVRKTVACRKWLHGVNIIITSGEQAVSKENSNDGVLTRI